MLLVSALFLGANRQHTAGRALGVLMVTAWRMNEWHLIRFYIQKRLKSPTTVMFVTMLATVTLDLTQAIIVGVVLSLLIFISQVSRLDIAQIEVDWDRLEKAGTRYRTTERDTGRVCERPLFFGAAHQLSEALEELGHSPLSCSRCEACP